MGWDKGSKDSQPAYTPAQTTAQAPQQDIGATIAPMLEYMNAQSAMSNANMQRSLALTNSSSQASMPVVESFVDIDYDKENQTLQDKINKQISDEDSKRKGVLGTILTSEDDDDEPSAVKSSLLSGS